MYVLPKDFSFHQPLVNTHHLTVITSISQPDNLPFNINNPALILLFTLQKNIFQNVLTGFIKSLTPYKPCCGAIETTPID